MRFPIVGTKNSSRNSSIAQAYWDTSPPPGAYLHWWGRSALDFDPRFLQAFDEFRRQVCRERDRCGARPRNQDASKGVQGFWRPFFVGEIQDLSRQIAKGGKRSYARSSACGGSSRRNLRGICSSSEAFVSLDIAPDNMIARRFDQDGAFRIGLTMAAPALLDSGFTERPKWLRSGI